LFAETTVLDFTLGMRCWLVVAVPQVVICLSAFFSFSNPKAWEKL
jgi:hypothetical protein